MAVSCARNGIDRYAVVAGRSNAGANTGIINDYPAILDLTQDAVFGQSVFRHRNVLTVGTADTSPLSGPPGAVPQQMQIILFEWTEIRTFKSNRPGENQIRDRPPHVGVGTPSALVLFVGSPVPGRVQTVLRASGILESATYRRHSPVPGQGAVRELMTLRFGQHRLKDQGLELEEIRPIP